jgi:glycosyltransferase involved in cell wall biosynthesis
MHILLVANLVDHGTTSITETYIRELKPDKQITITKGLKQLGLRNWFLKGLEIRKAARCTDVVICLNHGALVLGSIFIPRRRGLRKVAITEWTRAFPSRRRDLYIRFYNRIYSLIARRFDAVFCPSPGLRSCYKGMVEMQETFYPLPYPEITPDKWLENNMPITKLLYIGANIKRKAGDILLSMWDAKQPIQSQLTFVAPNTPKDAPQMGVRYLNHIKANTPEHAKLLSEHSLFILPTRHDSYGFAALEALNFGQVVVTTRFAGIADLVVAAGGLVGDSPEHAINMAFELASNPVELKRRRQLCKEFISAYPGHLASHLTQILRG